MIWLKINKICFDMGTYIFLAGVYIWDEKSPAYNVMNVNLFDILQDDIFAFSQLGTVLVCGDCNARVGNDARRDLDFIVNDRGVGELDSAEYQPDNDFMRVSPMIQSLTHTVLNFLICVKVARPILLRLANGRLQHDKQIGSYTYCNKNVHVSLIIFCYVEMILTVLGPA